MSSATTYTALHDWIVANVTSEVVIFENDTYTVPTDLSPWVLVEIAGTLYEQMSIGSGSPAAEKWREEGYLAFHVMVAQGTGTLRARQIAEAIANSMRGLEVDPVVRIQRMSIGEGQAGTDDGNFYQMILRVDWERN